MAEPFRERRAHRRFDLSCPVSVRDGKGRELFRGKTANVSEGGALVEGRTLPQLPVGATIHATLGVPRSTLNTCMLEEFFSGASIVRQELRPNGQVGIALRFARPLRLDLEV